MEIDAVLFLAAADPQDDAALLREFDGIAQKIHDDPAEFLFIAQEVTWQIGITVHDQIQMLAVIHSGRHVDDIGDGGGDVVALLRQFHLTGL